MIRRRTKPRRAFPKPGEVRRKREAVHVFPCGREVCSDTPAGRTEYKRRTLQRAEEQGWICRICGLAMNPYSVTLDHEAGRGMNAGHRDDRIFKDGKPYNAAVHFWCNGAKGSRRGYVNSKTELRGADVCD